MGIFCLRSMEAVVLCHQESNVAEFSALILIQLADLVFVAILFFIKFQTPFGHFSRMRGRGTGRGRDEFTEVIKAMHRRKGLS